MDQLERIRSHRRAVVAGCGAVALAAGIFGVTEGRAAAATTPETFSVVAGQPQVTTIDLGAPGKTPGDLYAITSPVFDGAGNQIGVLEATQTSIRLENKAETVQVSGTFEFGDGTITIGGLSLYPLEGTGNVPGQTFVRPVIGGTGRYAGVGGTVTTVRREDGRYDQRFSLTGAPPATVRFTTTSNRSTATRIDLGTSGASHGDATVITASLVDGGGQTAGALRGVSTIVETDGEAHGVSGSFTYDLPGGQLAVNGLADVPPAGGGLLTGVPFTRAVTGGTGRYAGSAGTVVTTRTESGGYQSTFEIQPRQKLTRKLRLHTSRGWFRRVDLPPAGQSPADLTVFGAKARDTRGRVVGRVRGVQTTVVRDGDTFVVQAGMTVDLRAGQIVVGGLSRYPANDNRPVRGRKFVRPVLGGTGRYAGARGTLTTITRKDGSFRQVFRLTS